MSNIVQLRLEPFIEFEKYPYTSSKKQQKQQPFASPFPKELQVCDFIIDGCDIHWKMLTTFQFKNKINEEFFSKVIELEKAKRRMQIKPIESFIKTKFRKSLGFYEKTIKTCPNCLDEICENSCIDNFAKPIYQEEIQK